MTGVPEGQPVASGGVFSVAEAAPGIPIGPDGPVFCEPWEAQAFSIVLALQQQGIFTWGEWAETLGREIRHAQQQGDPDTGQNYYRHWLAALERLVADRRLSDPSTLARYRDAWARAAARTPHGAPIELTEADFVNDHSALDL